MADTGRRLTIVLGKVDNSPLNVETDLLGVAERCSGTVTDLLIWGQSHSTWVVYCLFNACYWSIYSTKFMEWVEHVYILTRMVWGTESRTVRYTAGVGHWFLPACKSAFLWTSVLLITVEGHHVLGIDFLSDGYLDSEVTAIHLWKNLKPLIKHCFPLCVPQI